MISKTTLFEYLLYYKRSTQFEDKITLFESTFHFIWIFFFYKNICYLRSYLIKPHYLNLFSYKNMPTLIESTLFESTLFEGLL